MERGYYSRWQAQLSELQSVEWVSYIEPPPHEDCRPEFTRRWALHILPKGYTKVRRAGNSLVPVHLNLLAAPLSVASLKSWFRKGWRSAIAAWRIKISFAPH
jgi:hypothetical protein